MLDIYQINSYLIGLLGQETLTDFELKNLSIEIEKTSNNKLKEIKDFYLLELSIAVSYTHLTLPTTRYV